MQLTRFLLLLIASGNLIFPNISVSGVNLSELKVSEAQQALSEKIKPPKSIDLVYESQNYSIDTSELNLNYDFSLSAERAYSYTRTGNFTTDTLNKIDLYKNPVNLGLIANYDKTVLNKFLSIVKGQISKDPVEPKLDIVNNEVVFTNGSEGIVVDEDRLISDISQNIAYAKTENIQIETKKVDKFLEESEIVRLKERASKLIGKGLVVKFEYDTFTKNDRDLVKFLDPSGDFNEVAINKFVGEVSKKLDREAQNAKFVFADGKVEEFEPARDGVLVEKSKLADLIKLSLEGGDTNIIVPVKKTAPLITTDKINNLGIKELIGRGSSTYFHSIPGRVHNVALATSRINGTLVAPGETFSFNKTLGDVSKFTGYQSAYVIIGGKTVLGDGGGVCQVSTTLFRAVLDAGLPIDQRSAHAYRVGYYEQGSPPGIDATVYAPSPDFKFTNDTNEYILISAKADSKNYSLVFELYGTSDGRISNVTTPVITSQVAPPPDVYQDDPTLPVGTIKQVEHKAWGARVSFNYSVTRGGEEIYKKTFVSNYRPWGAVYLKGVKAQ